MREYRQLHPPKHKYQQEWYVKNRERIAQERKESIKPDRKQYNKDYRRKNIEHLRAYDRVRNKMPHRKLEDKQKHMELQFTWSNGHNGKEVWKKAELLAPQILIKEGFSGVERTNFYFPFDYWGKLDNGPIAIEVTCTYKRQKKSIVKRFLDFSNWRYFVLFITPDLNKYVLKEVPKDRSITRAIKSQKDIINMKEVNS